ncbi:MAG TPA: carbohydrate ABC transporter permease, partial [Acidimicrobiia bacterium]
ALLGTVLPFVFTVATSFKLHRDIAAGNWVFTPTFNNYVRLFTDDSSFSAMARNSVVVAVVATFVVVVVGGMAAYSLTRFNWPRWLVRGLIGWLVVVHLIPPVTFIFPLYSTIRSVGLYDSPIAVIVGHVVFLLPLTTFILLDFFQSVPKPIIEAARLEGADNLTLLTRIVLPLVSAGIGAAAILAFVFSWREYAFALSVSSTTAAATIPVGIASFVQENSIIYGEMAAASTLALIPALIGIFFAQKRIVGGLTLGAVVE